MRLLPPIPEPAEMDLWAIDVMGIYEAEGVKRWASVKCEQDLRAKGVIR